MKLRYADGVALGPAGSIYVLDHGDRDQPAVLVKVYAPSGLLLRSWRVAANVFGPNNIAADSAGNVYVSAISSPTVRKYSPTGQLLTRWRVPPSGSPGLDYVAGITVDPRGNLLAWEGNGRLETFDGQGQLLASWSGVGGAPAVDPSGAVYVIKGRAIVLLDASGHVVRQVAQVAFGGSLVAGPAGTLYAVQRGHRIVRFGTDGRFLGSVGSDRRIDWVHIAVAADGSIYVPQWNPILRIAAVVKLAPITAVDTTPPSVSIDEASTPSPRLLTRLTYTLSEDSSLRIVIKRRAATKNRRNRYFGRYMHKLTLDRATTRAGTHTLAIDWRAAGYQRRAPGSYQLTLVARDDAGNESRPVRVAFSAARR
jgi:sugar lactone lactonase YvrE